MPEKELYNYKRVTLIAIVINSIGLIINLTTFFHIEVIIDVFAEYSEYLFETGVNEAHVSALKKFVSVDHFWESVIYLLLSPVFSLLALIFVLKKKIIGSFRFLQISMAGFLVIVFHKFFIDIEAEAIDVLELFLVFLFLSGLFYHFSHLRKIGWFWSSSYLRALTTLNVQTGCGHACGFCAIPTLQGAPKSDILENIVSNAEQLASNGAKEVIIKGSSIASFGKGELGDLNHEHTFFDLMKTMDKIGEIDRFRFSTISTPLISKKTITFISKSIRFSPHFSIGMISGSNEILTLIPRPYKKEQYEQLFSDIKGLMPHAFISVDIVVGFPGETDALFEDTYIFLKKLRTISHINVWAYSEKKETPATKIKEGIVLKGIRIKRKKILDDLSTEKRIIFYKSQLGSERDVLFETGNQDGFIHGYTENHIKVKTAWFAELENTIESVQLTEIDNEGFMLFDFLNYQPTDIHSFRI